MSNKKNLLIYAHYYIPDTASTGQILRELAEGMLDKFNITIICVVPSYLGTIEDKYKTQKYYEEEINGVKVLRIRVPEFSKANKKSRVKNIVSYFFGAMGATFKVGKMDYVFSISQPPILGGLLGVWGKWVKHAKYIYNIQDFNPEQVLAVGYTKSKFVTDAMMWFDKFSCKRSDLIITVGRDLVETVENRFKGKKVPKTVMINNWIDENEIYPLDENNEKVLAFKKKYGLDGKFVIMYSGNIGLYYDLENLMKVVERIKPGKRMGKSRSANSVRNVSFGFAQQLITLVLAFVTRTIFVRKLGAEYTGVNGLYTNILTLLSLAELGIGNVLTYSLYGALHDNDHEKLKQLISYYRKLYRYIAAAVTVVGLAIVPFLGQLVKSTLPHNEVVLYYLLFLCNSVVSYFVMFKVTLLRADQKEYIRNIVATICLLLQYVLQIAFLYVNNNYTTYLIIQIFFTIMQNVVCNVIANKYYPFLKEYTKETNLIDKKGLISDVKSMFVYKVSNVVVTSTDNILISMLLGTIYVGFYSNYSMIINYIATFINLMITGLIASLGNLNADNNSEHSYSVFKGMVYLFGVITIFCSVCVLNAIQGFIPIWVGSEYVLEKDVLIAILATFYVTHAFDPTWMFCETMGLFKERKNAMVINAILNILLSIVLAKPFGMTGILGATAIARVLTIVWWEPYILFKKKFKRPLADYFKQQAGIIGSNVLIVIISYMLCSFVSESFIGLVMRVVISGLTVLLVELIFMRKTEEFAWAKNKLKQIIHR